MILRRDVHATLVAIVAMAAVATTTIAAAAAAAAAFVGHEQHHPRQPYHYNNDNDNAPMTAAVKTTARALFPREVYPESARNECSRHFQLWAKKSSSSSKDTTEKVDVDDCIKPALVVQEVEEEEEEEEETAEETESTETTTRTTATFGTESAHTGGEEEQLRRQQQKEESLQEESLLAVLAAEEAVDEERQAAEEQQRRDETYMRMAIDIAAADGGEMSIYSAYPQPTVGAVLVSNRNGRVLGQGKSTYNTDAIRSAIASAGLEVTPLTDWCVAWPADDELRRDLEQSTLYVTLEPSKERHGTALPAITKLIEQTGISRVVIGSADPVPERARKGAASLHAAGIDVSVGTVLPEECATLIEEYSALANSKLQRMARVHFKQFGRPLGFLHCSVVDSDNLEAFARHGNAFGTNFGGSWLSYRDSGTYEIAPPPEVIWAGDEQADDQYEDVIVADSSDNDNKVDMFDAAFEEEEYQEEMKGVPVMPWYEQVDAVCATFPRPGNGPSDDNSVTARLNGFRWLATHGNALPAGVERILVMDATDLVDLPMTNDHSECRRHKVDAEAFWRGENRKPTRVLLRRGMNAQARAAARAAAVAAQAAADAAEKACAAMESGDAARAAQAALDYQKLAQMAAETIQQELSSTQQLRSQLESYGTIVETIEGGEPIDVMNHLGKRNGLHSVVWRAGCWGERGVQAILAGAFQWVSAHLAVDAVGGKFWQLMLAENAVQAACGPERRVKIFADQEDISLEYCDEPDADNDCNLTIDGKPVRHVRLDCRIALVDPNRPREFVTAKTKKIDKKIIREQAPWFL